MVDFIIHMISGFSSSIEFEMSEAALAKMHDHNAADGLLFIFFVMIFIAIALEVFLFWKRDWAGGKSVFKKIIFAVLCCVLAILIIGILYFTA